MTRILGHSIQHFFFCRKIWLLRQKILSTATGLLYCIVESTSRIHLLQMLMKTKQATLTQHNQSTFKFSRTYIYIYPEIIKMSGSKTLIKDHLTYPRGVCMLLLNCLGVARLTITPKRPNLFTRRLSVTTVHSIEHLSLKFIMLVDIKCFPKPILCLIYLIFSGPGIHPRGDKSIITSKHLLATRWR